MMRIVIAVLAMAFMAVSARAGAKQPTLVEVPVTGMKSVAPDSYAAAAQLAARGAAPIEIALGAVGPFEGRTQHIIQENEGGEAPSSSTVTIIRAGFLDDAVWGQRWQIALDRTASGVWKISTVKKAWGCRRGAHVDEFGTKVCP